MSVDVGGRTGLVQQVGQVDTLIREGGRCWSIPKGRLPDESAAR